MANKIKLVKTDTAPPILASLTDVNTGLPIDLTSAVCLMNFRALGSTTIKSVMPGTLLAGKVKADGISIDLTPPYNVAGAGGRVSFAFQPTTLDTAGEFEGEIKITFPDTTVQHVYNTYKFTVRNNF